MSRQSSAPPPPVRPPRSQTPTRLPAGAAGRSVGDVFKAVGAILALATLVLAVPAALVVLVGWPLPHEVPDTDTFRQPMSSELFVRVLAVLVWIAWAQFAACVLVEVKGVASGVGMPGRVPGSTASQALARQLVAAVLLLGATAGSVAPVVSDLARPSAAAVQAQQQPASVGQQQASGTGAGQHGSADGGTHRRGERANEPTAQSQRGEQDGSKLYVVQPPEGRHHDNLWDIAGRHLKDPRRWTEIYELNKDHQQPDGGKLTKASLIYPGWVLRMPADAHGGDLLEAHPDESHAPHAPHSDPAPSGPSQHGDFNDLDGTTGASSPDTAVPETGLPEPGGAAGAGAQAPRPGAHTSAQDTGLPDRLTLALASAPLLAAVLLAALGRRRREQLWRRAFGGRLRRLNDDAAETEETLRVGADEDAASFLDAALRQLSADLSETRTPLPAVYAARLDEQGLDLLLAPPEPHAPAGWEARHDGAVWHLPRNGAPPAPEGTDELVAPYPGLTPLGTDDGQHVLVDLEAASGLIALTGPERLRKETLAAIAAGLAVSPWADDLRLTLVGFGEELQRLAPHRVHAVPHLDDVLDSIEEEAAERASALAASGLDSVLSGRTGGPGARLWQPHYVIVGDSPSEQAAERLARLSATSHRTAIGHLVAGEMPGASWEWQVNEDGRLAIELLELDVAAQRLPERQYAALVDLFGTVDEAPRRADTSEEEPAWLPSVRPTVEIGLLGPLRVRGGGPLEPERAALCHEALVHLLLHRDGVHVNVLASAVWPRGVSADVRNATLARLTDWLGQDSNGRPQLTWDDEGRLVLGSEICSDWDLFLALLERADSTPERAEQCWDQALSLVRGPVLADRAQGRYAWLAHESFETDVAARIADVAVRLAARRLQAGEAEAAVRAVRSGLCGNPDDESLWFALVRTTDATGDREQLRAVAEELLRHVTERLGAPEPDARLSALLDEVLPGWRQEVAVPA